MAYVLPQEILSLIVDYADIGDDKLTPYTLVNKSWQSAFERRIYASVVVLSPSATTVITTSLHKYEEKRGFSIVALHKLTNARKAHIRHILYRVAVPYWLDFLRTKAENYTYDNTWRCGNNQAFSKGVRALFEYLSTAWPYRTISLDIALQAENAYVTDEDDDDGHEPNTYPFPDGSDDDLAPYFAEFPLNFHLPSAKCVTSLEFPKIDIPTFITDEYSPLGSRSASENQMSVPAILKIATACGTLQTLVLNAEYGIPYTEPVLRKNARDATVAALSQLPPSLQSIRYIGDSLYELEGPGYPTLTDKQDTLCTAFHTISTRLRSLHVDNEAVFPELFCPDGSQGLLRTHWPYLETLRLKNIDIISLSGGISRYTDGSFSYDTTVEIYMDDLYTKAGYAAQRMPRLNDLLIQSTHDHELAFTYYKGKWSLQILNRNCDTHVPSSRVLEAWKVPGGQLKRCPRAHTQGAIYTSWPPV
jgi:hypothetical protein